MKHQLSLYEFISIAESNSLYVTAISLNKRVGKGIDIKEGFRFYGYKDNGFIRVCRIPMGGEMYKPAYQPFLIPYSSAKVICNTKHYIDAYTGDIYMLIDSNNNELDKDVKKTFTCLDTPKPLLYIGGFRWAKSVLRHSVSELFNFFQNICNK